MIYRPTSLTHHSEPEIFNIVGDSNQHYSYSNPTKINMTIQNNNEVNDLTKKALGHGEFELEVELNGEKYSFGNCLITSYDLNVVQGGLPSLDIDLVTIAPQTITIDIKDKKDIVMLKTEYDTFQKHYGKPEDMYYDEFYDKYVAVKI